MDDQPLTEIPNDPEFVENISKAIESCGALVGRASPTEYVTSAELK
jgi:hypothetical protein